MGRVLNNKYELLEKVYIYSSLTPGRTSTSAENERNREISPKRRASLRFDSIHTLGLACSPLRDVAEINLMHISINVSQRLFSDISQSLNVLIVLFLLYFRITIFKLIYRCSQNKSMVSARKGKARKDAVKIEKN